MARVSIFQTQTGESVPYEDIEESMQSRFESAPDSGQFVISHDNENQFNYKGEIRTKSTNFKNKLKIFQRDKNYTQNLNNMSDMDSDSDSRHISNASDISDFHSRNEWIRKRANLTRKFRLSDNFK